jgi:hypothetical protein
MAVLKQHVREIIEGKAFKGSHRSVRFLEHILDQAISGHFEELKERIIGIELFGRSPSYETSEDSIVRVAASEVRKRLTQHYLIYGETSKFHLSLPLGSYVLEVTCNAPGKRALSEPGNEQRRNETVVHEAAVVNQDPLGAEHESAFISHPNLHNEAQRAGHLNWRHWLVFGGVLAAASLAQWGIFSNRGSHAKAAGVSVLPWSAFFGSPRNTVLVTSDPNIAEIQVLARRLVSVSDYANRHYIPEPNTLSPEEIRFCQEFLLGDKSAGVDTPIAVGIAQLASANSRKLDVRGARSIQLSDLHMDDNFIFLGSPGSNPWVNLFIDQLDFRFDPITPGQDRIVNVHPRPHELPVYVPAAPGGTTGQSFATVAFIKNAEQNGQILILAGDSREGTEAAGELIVDLPRLSTALQNCGIPPSGPVKHFEMLLRVNMMAGSPNSTEVIACHIKPDTAGS